MRIKPFELFFALMTLVGCTSYANTDDGVEAVNKYKGQILVPLPPVIYYLDDQ